MAYWFGALKKMFPVPGMRYRLNREILKNNDISVLILDERWNSLFADMEKPGEIVRLEEKLKELLKKQARLTSEEKEISMNKKNMMERIIKLTTEAFENGNESAKTKMAECERDIKDINDRLNSIDDELKKMPSEIREANLELLECLVNTVYLTYRENQKRREELDELIKVTSAKLDAYVAEKEKLSKTGGQVYEYFHELLGAEELQRLDEQYLSGRVRCTDEGGNSRTDKKA